MAKIPKISALNRVFVGEVTIFGGVNDTRVFQLHRCLEKRCVQYPCVILALLTAGINWQLLQF